MSEQEHEPHDFTVEQGQREGEHTEDKFICLEPENLDWFREVLGKSVSEIIVAQLSFLLGIPWRLDDHCTYCLDNGIGFQQKSSS